MLIIKDYNTFVTIYHQNAEDCVPSNFDIGAIYFSLDFQTVLLFGVSHTALIGARFLNGFSCVCNSYFSLLKF